MLTNTFSSQFSVVARADYYTQANYNVCTGYSP